MAPPMKENMSMYKPGSVSASLFGKKKGTDANTSSVAELFSSHKHSPSVKKEVKLQKANVHFSQIDPNKQDQKKSSSKKKKSRKKSSLTEENLGEKIQQDNKQDRPKKKVKKKEQGTKLSVNGSFQKPKKVAVVKDTDGTSDSLPLNHHVMQSTTLKPTAKKRKNQGEDEDETPSKRVRKYRHRDKTDDNRTIFIGNCSLSTDKKTLKSLFGKFGAIDTIRFRCAPAAQLELPRRAIVITKNFHEQSSSFVAFIVFKEEEAAQKALSMNGHLLNGLHLRVDLASQSKQHDKKKSIFLGNLPFDTKEEQLRAHFDDCGDIVNVRVIRDRRTSLGKGIAYIQFESKDLVSLALKLDNSDFRGRPMRVRVCSNNPEKIEERKSKRDSSSKSKPAASSVKEKKMTFAPSNRTNISFHSVLKTKKEKRLKRNKRKRVNAKKTDGLSSVFGDNDQEKKRPKDKKGKVKHNVKGAKGKKREKGSKVAGRKFQGKGKGSKKS